jgi:hypothetical protein
VNRRGLSMIVALALAGSVACAHAPGAPPATDGKPIPERDRAALFERKCGLCHPATWVSYGTETRDEWAKLVARMRKLKRGWISDEEAAAIVDYRAVHIVRY